MICDVKHCRSESVIMHRPTNQNLCEEHWKELCRKADELYELKKNKGKVEI